MERVSIKGRREATSMGRVVWAGEAGKCEGARGLYSMGTQERTHSLTHCKAHGMATD